MNNKEINQSPSERGITLIALIVMIVIIVILSAIGIKSLTGNDGIVDVTSDAAEDYKIVSYKEQIEQVVYSTVVAFSARGETPTIEDISNDLADQDWVRTAVPYDVEEPGIDYVIVQVNEGYVYQVFYDPIYGDITVEYLGKDDPNNPIIVNSKLTLRARYAGEITSIIANAKDEEKGVAKLELYYKGELLQDLTIKNPSETEKWQVKDRGKGIYIVKATSNSGAVRTAKVRVRNVKDGLDIPVITVSPAEANGKNGWYTTPINVTITSTSPSTQEIRYRMLLNGVETTPADGEKYTGAFTINTVGEIAIYAWTVSGEYESEESAPTELKFDNEPPVVTEAKLTKGNKRGDWLIENRRNNSKSK